MSEDIHEYDSHGHEPMPEGEEKAPPFTHAMAIIRWVILGAMTVFACVMILNYFGATPWANASEPSSKYHCPMHPTYVANQPGDCPICGMTLVAIDATGKEVRTGDGANADATRHGDLEKTIARPGQYTCPMHPEVVSDTLGRCPKCGMNLEQVPHPALPGQYTCPMHPEVVSDTLGRCPKCGMNLEQVPHPALPGQYTCPMHPEVVSDTLGRCPKCGMNLEQVRPPTDSLPRGHNMSGEMGRTQSAASDMGSSPVPGLVPVTIEPKRLQLIGVRTGTVSMRSLNGSLRLVGYITPDETRLSNVQIRFSGWVKELAVDQTGQFVKANQRLLSVYSPDLFQAENEYLIARQATERAADDFLRETRRQLVNAARQRLELLGVPSEEISRIETANSPGSELWIRSPFSGIVLEKGVVTGQFINPDQNLFTIADLGKVWVLADVYERDLGGIRIGQPARMTTSAYPGESFEGKIGFIYPTVSEQTRTLKIRIEFSNSSNRLKPGMYAEVELAGQGNAVLAVPADAVMDGGDRQYAFVVHDGIHFEPRLLKLGQSSDDYFEVLSGLAVGEQVVTSANFLIDSESRLMAAIVGMGGTQPNAHTDHGK